MILKGLLTNFKEGYLFIYKKTNVIEHRYLIIYYIFCNQQVSRNLNPFSEPIASTCAQLSATRIDEEMETEKSFPYPVVVRSNPVPVDQPRIVRASANNHREIDQSRLFDACARPFNNHTARKPYRPHVLTTVNSNNFLNQNQDEMMEVASTSSIPAQI